MKIKLSELITPKRTAFINEDGNITMSTPYIGEHRAYYEITKEEIANNKGIPVDELILIDDID